MKLSLRMKLVAAFVFMGLTVLGVSSAVYYISFERSALEEVEIDLLEDAHEFAETILYSNGIVSVIDHHEWDDADDEYIVATDAQFKTIKKSPNVGNLELQRLFDFQPVNDPQTIRVDVDAVELMCVVLPVKRDDSVVAYILVTTSVEQVTEYVDILKDSILISLIFLVLFGIGAAYLFANRMVRPVLSIQRAVGEIELENLDQRIELVRGDTELDSLVDTLNSLFARLEKSYNQINDFSANVAHELHTPLTILRGNIEVALTRDRQRDEYVEILSDLLEETLHIIHLVDSMLLLARGDTSSLSIHETSIDLDRFCGEHSGDWEALCSLKNQSLRIDIGDPRPIVGDKNMLSQLFLNLVSNASKFSKDGQLIDIEIREKERAFNGNDGVQITVKDEGIGVPAKDQAKVFERFYRIQKDRSRETGGAGLGLSICGMIARLHGGTISLTSEVGKGTSVRVTIPVRDGVREGK